MQSNVQYSAVNTSPSATMTKDKQLKKWQVYQGKSRICCDGRVVMSHQASVLYLTLGLIIVTSGLFFAFDCRFLVPRVSWAVPVMAGVLVLFTLSSLLRAALMDPGIIPRASKTEAEFLQKQLDEDGNSAPASASYRPPPRTMDVQIGEQTFRLKYCFTCKIFRPPRASHCSVCDNCVERFDHHCPWVGNCVGRRNYRYFYLFLLSCSLLCVYVFSFNIVNIVLLSKEDGVLNALKLSWATFLQAVVAFFSMWSVLGLCGFHTYLVGSQVTTNEDIKKTFDRRNRTRNPFDKGSYCKNAFYIVCGPLPPSLSDFRGYVLPQDVKSDSKTTDTQTPGTERGGATIRATWSNGNTDTQTAVPV